MEDLPVTTVIATAGFFAAAVFGAIVNRTNFCAMGGISDMILMGDSRRFRAWLLAMAVAIAGTQAMHGLGIIDINTSIYLSPNLGWLGAIAGGLMFGFGMTMAGGCAIKNLVRIGGGNLKSVMVIIIMGIFAYTTLRGLIGLGRVSMEAATNIDLSQANLESQGIPDMIAVALGMEVGTVRGVLAVILVGGLLFFCFKDSAFRASVRDIFAGVSIGALILVAWWITGVLGQDDFDPVQLTSFSFVSPTGDSLQYLMTFSGATINFGVSAVGGVIAGSFVAAMAGRAFNLESFTSSDDMLRNMTGAALMGTGGVMALGCTIGQGLTGLSTLALGSLIALVSIILGCVLGMKYLEEGSLGGAIGALFSSD